MFPAASTLTGVRGLTADLLHWPSPEKARTVLLFICGNPGLVSYYPVFLGSIAKALPSTTVYAIGHLGQSLTTPSEDPSAVATLREQVEAKIQFVDTLQKEYDIGQGEGKAKLILMGHSIGAWICCEVIKARPELVSSIHLLFPTLSRMAISPNGVPLIRYGSSLVPVFGAFSSAFSYLPTSIMTTIVGLVTSQAAAGAKVTTGLVTNPPVVRNALSMAREEMDQILDLDRETLKEFGGRMRFYHAEKDGWVLETCIADIYQTLDEAGHDKARRVRCTDGMVHAFILDVDKADLLAQRCAKWIVEDFGSQ